MNTTETTKEMVIHQITNAFSNVKLGDGIGLWEAQAIDDYESKEKQKKARLKDEKEDWGKFSIKTLNRCDSSLSFFDADGMRFHLPAFILSSMNNSDMLDPVFHLVHLSNYSKKQFGSLSNIQQKAIISYLEWCLTQDEYEYERNNIIMALTIYWNKL